MNSAVPSVPRRSAHTGAAAEVCIASLAVASHQQPVYVAFSLDESVMGFAFPKDERAALVASDLHKFRMPSASDMRFNSHRSPAVMWPERGRPDEVRVLTLHHSRTRRRRSWDRRAPS